MQRFKQRNQNKFFFINHLSKVSKTQKLVFRISALIFVERNHMKPQKLKVSFEVSDI
jgi:hypothetical protein